MAKFLDTTGVSYHLQQIINQARETLILISPYLKMNQRLRQSLEDKDRMKIDIRVVYGKTELQPGELTWLRGLQSVRTSFCENLHAKCYLNESEALITSMNLYEFSQVNNHEMGIYVAKATDPQLYDAIHTEARRLIRIGEEVRLSAEVVEVEAVEPLKKAASTVEAGFCIRCRNQIARNREAPYCATCYRVWKKYENPTYPEKYCHVCGKDNVSTFSKPACYACFKQDAGKMAAKG